MGERASASREGWLLVALASTLMTTGHEEPPFPKPIWNLRATKMPGSNRSSQAVICFPLGKIGYELIVL